MEASPPRSKGRKLPEALLQQLQKIGDTRDSVDEMKEDIFTCVNQLPRVMEVSEKEQVVKAMEELHGKLKSKMEHTRTNYNAAEKSYSQTLIELIDEHPYIVDEEWFKDKISDQQKISFELNDETITENKLKITVRDIQRAKELLEDLQKAEEAYVPLCEQMKKLCRLISCVDLFIKSKKVVEEDDDSEEEDDEMSPMEEDDDVEVAANP